MYSLPSPLSILSRLAQLNQATHRFDKVELSTSKEQAVASQHTTNNLFLVFDTFKSEGDFTTASSLKLKVSVILISYFTSSYDSTGQGILPSIFTTREALVAWLHGFVPEPVHDDYLRYEGGKLLHQDSGNYHYLDSFSYTSLRELPSVALADLVNFLSTHSTSPLIDSQTSLTSQP